MRPLLWIAALGIATLIAAAVGCSGTKPAESGGKNPPEVHPADLPPPEPETKAP